MLCEERSILLVAESKDAVCGFLAGSRTGPEWELDNIAVESRMRRKGAGRMLLQRFLEKAKLADAQKIFLQVREDNLAARELYEGAGFRITGKRSGYYRGQDAVLYVFEFTRRS